MAWVEWEISVVPPLGVDPAGHAVADLKQTNILLNYKALCIINPCMDRKRSFAYF